VTQSTTNERSPSTEERAPAAQEPSVSDAPSPAPMGSKPRGRWGRSLVTGGVGLLVGIGIGAAFAPRGVQEAVVPPAAAEPPSRLVRLPDALARSAGLESTRVSATELASTLDVVGTVEFDQQHVADVGARIEGRIVRVLVSVGETVEEGQPLAQIESPELGEVMAELLAARARREAARTSADREQGLRQRQLTTARTLETASARADALDAEVRGIEQRLLALGVTEGELRQMERTGTPIRRITLRAPIAGEVVERHAHLGQVVSPTEPLLRIADLTSLWVMLEVYERDLARVHERDAVEILSEAYPGATFSGSVDHIDATIDERTRTASVRIVVANAERRLRPGQFVHALLSTGGPRRNAIVLPRSAIVQLEGLPSVFLARGQGQYEPRAVQLGAAMSDRVEITAGVSAGEEVVVQGAFALKSEMQR
jgi:cobalt-zinc-cadmium efflux system membrane fusion protein